MTSTLDSSILSEYTRAFRTLTTSLDAPVELGLNLVSPYPGKYTKYPEEAYMLTANFEFHETQALMDRVTAGFESLQEGIAPVPVSTQPTFMESIFDNGELVTLVLGIEAQTHAQLEQHLGPPPWVVVEDPRDTIIESPLHLTPGQPSTIETDERVLIRGRVKGTQARVPATALRKAG